MTFTAREGKSIENDVFSESYRCATCWYVRYRFTYNELNRTYPFNIHFNPKTFTRSGVRTHADICPLELKSNALTTRPSWFESLADPTMGQF